MDINELKEYIGKVVKEEISKTARNYLIESHLDEMATIGMLTPKLRILVYTNDPGNIPHFHIVDSDTNGHFFNCCIEIKNNRYFKHGAKTDTLNNRDRKGLVGFLNSIDKDFGIPYWRVLLIEWNRNNSNVQVDKDQPMPDYLHMRE